MILDLYRKKQKKWSPRTSALLVIGGFLVAQTVPLFVQGIVNALSDTTPPVVQSFIPSTSSINVDDAQAQVTLTGAVTDDISGFGSIKLYYTSPSGLQVVEAETLGSTPTSFEARVTFPRYAEAGTWTPTATFADVSGNVVDYTSQELANLGFSLSVSVSSATPDTQSPTLTALTQEDTSLDTTNYNGQTGVRATLPDNLSGFAKAVIKFTSPSGAHSSTADFESTVTPDEYYATPIFSMYVETGHWNAQLTVTDLAGNVRVYDTADLAGMGFPNGIDIAGTPDTSFVTIESIAFSPLFDYGIEPYVGGGLFTIKALLSDNLSGVQTADLIYRSQTSGQIAYSNTFVRHDDPEIDQFDYYIQTPAYSAEGEWLPELYTTDIAGNTKTFSHSDLLGLGLDLKIVIGENVTETVIQGDSVTTDTSGSGATAETIVQAEITTPTAGTVSITPVETAAQDSNFGGYSLFSEQFSITAPAATVTEPLVLKFVVDATQLADIDPSEIVIFRDGQAVAQCLGSSVAVPDPCVTAVTVLPSGDAEITVNSSHASRWSLGVETATQGSFQFEKFKKPLKAAPQLNKEEAGSSIPVKFSVGGDYGLDILASGSPTSQRINCSTKEPIGDATATNAANNKNLKYSANGFYRYTWKTLKKWDDTCRQFTLTFTTGEVATVYFKFD